MFTQTQICILCIPKVIQNDTVVGSCIQARYIPNLVLELDIIDKIPWIMCALILSGFLEADDTFGRELNLNRREWRRAVGGGRGGWRRARRGRKVVIISNSHAAFAIYMGRALTYMCWFSSGGVLTLIIFSGTKILAYNYLFP